MLIVQLADLNHISVDTSRLSYQVIDVANKLQGQRQKQFLVCRSILANLLQKYYHVAMLPTIISGDNNRPAFFDTSLPDFNISHSKHYVAVAISGNGKIGLDIELNRERKNYLGVAKAFFSDIENAWLNEQPNKLHAFWQLWTLKESALKLYAKGVWQMKSVSIDLAKAFVTAPFADQFYYQYHQIGAIHLSVNSNQPIRESILLSHQKSQR